MKHKELWIVVLGLSLLAAPSLRGWTLPKQPRPGDRMFAQYLQHEVHRLAQQTRQRLRRIRNAKDWETQRKRWRRQLREMLGLDPEPPRTPLHPVITGRIERDGIIVEKLYFQSLPHLYVTADLYRPKELKQPAPAILYACGHGRVVVHGISCGNKTHYQHHGIWFARHGYVCLLIDTIQLGEIMGIHHGTYRYGMWWWNSRGYTPAGVEAWNCIRALDYLCSRPEVDTNRIGMTGRSGGGAYTWFTTALDDRIRVAAPIAGITDLQNHVVDDTVEGHCDCMFFVNTYRWDYPMLAALAAPRPLLFGNSDQDRIFPLDGVMRTYWQVRKVYAQLDQLERLGLLITEGPHRDTQALRVPVFHWFNRFLKGTDALIHEPAKPWFDPMELRVFSQLPKDQINTRIQELFIPPAQATGPADPQWLRTQLRQKTFRAWPRSAPMPHVQRLWQEIRQGVECTAYALRLATGFTLRAYRLRRIQEFPQQILLQPVNQDQFVAFLQGPARPFASRLAEERSFAGLNSKTPAQEKTSSPPSASASLTPPWDQPGTVWIVFTPSGVGWTLPWDNPVYRRMLRRRLMLIGTTLASLQTWDILQALRSIPQVAPAPHLPVILRGQGPMANLCLLAALMDQNPRLRLDLQDLILDEKTAPDFLNLTRYTSWPQLLATVQKSSRLSSPHAQTKKNKTSVK